MVLDRTTKFLLAAIAIALWGFLLRPFFFVPSAQAGSGPSSTAPTSTWFKLSSPKNPTAATWINLDHAGGIGFYTKGNVSYAEIRVPGGAYATTDPHEMAALRNYVAAHRL